MPVRSCPLTTSVRSTRDFKVETGRLRYQLPTAFWPRLLGEDLAPSHSSSPVKAIVFSLNWTKGATSTTRWGAGVSF
ncbi:hypothetical protein D3C78_1856080 [compost metagenome]